jgi:hypothetical protein
MLEYFAIHQYATNLKTTTKCAVGKIQFRNDGQFIFLEAYFMSLLAARLYNIKVWNE